MATLYLMRHAHAAPAERNLKDQDRPLSRQGTTDAAKMGFYLKQQKAVPGQWMCSTALRAQQTAQLLAEAWGYEPGQIRHEPELYEASVRTFLVQVCRLQENASTAIMVGHNPTISYLAEYLSGANIGVMEPGSVCVLSFEGAWQEASKDLFTYQGMYNVSALN